MFEISRCVVYFPFDYYFVSSVDWQIGRNELLLLNITLWFCRSVHIASIIFWLFYQFVVCIQSNSNNNQDYEVADKVDKDLESDTSSMRRRNTCMTIFLFFAVLLGIGAFLIAWMSRSQSCANMLNQWNLG